MLFVKNLFLKVLRTVLIVTLAIYIPFSLISTVKAIDPESLKEHPRKPFPIEIRKK